MKKIILLSAILFSCCCFAQNGTTIIYNKKTGDKQIISGTDTTRSSGTKTPTEKSTNISSGDNSFRAGMIASSSIALLGCGILAAGATAEPTTIDGARKLAKTNQLAYIMCAAGFAGIIITNISFTPTGKVSLTTSADGIGLRYRL